MITQSEAEIYARMTLKQYGFEDHSIFWNTRCKTTAGFANPWEKRIELNPIILSRFALFNYTLKHELAHLIQFFRMGKTYKVNGRNNFHGKVFKEVCAELKINPKGFGLDSK